MSADRPPLADETINQEENNMMLPEPRHSIMRACLLCGRTGFNHEEGCACGELERLRRRRFRLFCTVCHERDRVELNANNVLECTRCHTLYAPADPNANLTPETKSLPKKIGLRRLIKIVGKKGRNDFPLLRQIEEAQKHVHALILKKTRHDKAQKPSACSICHCQNDHADDCLAGRLNALVAKQSWLDCTQCRNKGAVSVNMDGVLECRQCGTQFCDQTRSEALLERGQGKFPMDNEIARLQKEIVALKRNRI